MLSILNQLKNEICPICGVGNPYKILGYSSSGSCMDYVYEKLNVPYSIAWEIYTNEKNFKELDDYIKNKEIKNIFSKKINNLKKGLQSRISFFETNTQVYLKSQNYRRLYKSRDFSDNENRMCFKLFNPDNKNSYDFIINIWRKVI